MAKGFWRGRAIGKTEMHPNDSLNHKNKIGNFMLIFSFSIGLKRRETLSLKLHSTVAALLLGIGGSIGLNWGKVVAANPLSWETARHRTASELLTEAQDLVLQGQIEPAISLFNEARVVNPFFQIGANAWNQLCWYGSLRGYAADVLEACDTAVSLAPENLNILDSRGLARALTGDTAGAIDDFKAFVEQTDDEVRKFQRQGWIDSLNDGENPFTPDVLRLLFLE